MNKWKRRGKKLRQIFVQVLISHFFGQFRIFFFFSWEEGGVHEGLGKQGDMGILSLSRIKFKAGASLV